MSGTDANEAMSDSDGMTQSKPDIGCLSLVERMEALLGNEKASDVTFIVGDKDKGPVERIPAVSGLLVATSEVFQAMFIGDLPRPKEEYVPDAEPEAFKIMLRYIYTDKLNIGLDYALPVLYLAKKYMLTKLSNEVVETVSKLLTAKNVCQLLQSAGLAEEIREICMNLITRASSEALKSEAFLSSSAHVVADIVRMDELRIREKEVYFALVKWAKQQLVKHSKPINIPNVRDVLGDLLYLIRFPLMSAYEFGMSAKKMQLLSAEEKVSIFQWFAIGEKPEKFSCVQRATKPTCISLRFPLINFASFVKNEANESLSEPVSIGALKWRIVVRTHRSDPGSLAVYVYAEGSHAEDEDDWIYNANFTLRILSQRYGTRDIVEHINTKQFDESSMQGNSQFAAIRDLLNPAKGFLKNDTIVLTADVFPEDN